MEEQEGGRMGVPLGLYHTGGTTHNVVGDVIVKVGENAAGNVLANNVFNTSITEGAAALQDTVEDAVEGAVMGGGGGTKQEQEAEEHEAVPDGLYQRLVELVAPSVRWRSGRTAKERRGPRHSLRGSSSLGKHSSTTRKRRGRGSVTSSSGSTWWG